MPATRRKRSTWSSWCSRRPASAAPPTPPPTATATATAMWTGTTSSSSPRSGSGKLASPPSSGFLKRADSSGSATGRPTSPSPTSIASSSGDASIGRRCRGRRGCCPWRACPWPPRWRSAGCRRCRSSTPATTTSARRRSAGWSCSCCPRSGGAWAQSRPSTSSPASPRGSTRTAAPAPVAASPSRPSVSSLPRPKVAGSVLDHRPSTVAAAAILAATYGPLLTKEALDSKMNYLPPSCLIEKEHVHACYSMMVGDMNRRGNKRSLPRSGSNEVASSTYDSVLVDDVTDTAAFATAVAARNKRIRLELPGIR